MSSDELIHLDPRGRFGLRARPRQPLASLKPFRTSECSTFMSNLLHSVLLLSGALAAIASYPMPPLYFLWVLVPFEHRYPYSSSRQARTVPLHCDIRGFRIAHMYVHRFQTQESTPLSSFTAPRIRGCSASGSPTVGFLGSEDHARFSGYGGRMELKQVSITWILLRVQQARGGRNNTMVRYREKDIQKNVQTMHRVMK